MPFRCWVGRTRILTQCLPEDGNADSILLHEKSTQDMNKRLPEYGNANSQSSSTSSSADANEAARILVTLSEEDIAQSGPATNLLNVKQSDPPPSTNSRRGSPPRKGFFKPNPSFQTSISRPLVRFPESGQTQGDVNEGETTEEEDWERRLQPGKRRWTET